MQLFTKMTELSHRRKRRLATFIDAVICIIALAITSYFNRLDHQFSHVFVVCLFAVSAIIAVLSHLFYRVYRGVIRHLDARIGYQILISTGTAAFITGIGLALLSLPNLNGVPSWALTYWAMLFALTAGWRIFLYFNFQRDAAFNSPRVSVGIYGTDAQSKGLARSLKASEKYIPRFILDDNPSVIGATLWGLRVYATEKLEWAMSRYDARTVVFDSSHTHSEHERSLMRYLLEKQVDVRIQPDFDGVPGTDSELNKFRKLGLEDLLRRNQRLVNMDLMIEAITDKVILVTGAAGSIGSQLCRSIMVHNPRCLMVLDINETALKELVESLAKDSQTELKMFLGSTLDENVLKEVFAAEIDAVFHCAAYKHVEMGEVNPVAMVSNNIFGTINILTQVRQNKVPKFVQVSTDKAVYPANMMGASKRICELLVVAEASGLAKSKSAKDNTAYCNVRFGNVLETQGSVIPIFKKQIAAGGPVTITHPQMRRFFMSINEAAELILQAAALSQGGETFSLDMGEPVMIKDVAETLINLAGMKVRTEKESGPGTIEIRHTGIKQGEKLEEQLFGANERLEKTSHPSIFKCEPLADAKSSGVLDLHEIKHFLAEANADELRAAVFRVVEKFNGNKMGNDNEHGLLEKVPQKQFAG